MQDTEKDINGLGKRVNDLEIQQAKQQEILDYLKTDHKAEVDNRKAEQKEIWKGIDELRKHQEELVRSFDKKMNEAVDIIHKEFKPMQRKVQIIVGIGVAVSGLTAIASAVAGFLRMVD